MSMCETRRGGPGTVPDSARYGAGMGEQQAAPRQDALWEPSMAVGDPGELLVGFLDGYRDALARKLAGLSEEQLVVSRVPSGWSPLGLVWHLTNVERRWLRWGFAGERLDDVWADADPDETDAPWRVPVGATAASLLAAHRDEVDRCRAAVAGHEITERGATTGRFADADPAPTLGWIYCHLIQEYARHLGHLDITRELADGGTGE
jgi:hypothetical protein